MKKKTVHYTDYPVRGEVIPDFLPKPEDLVLKDDSMKVTITLSETTVIFFKLMAKKHNTKYQKMIRNLLDQYVRCCLAQQDK